MDACWTCVGCVLDVCWTCLTCISAAKLHPALENCSQLQPRASRLQPRLQRGPARHFSTGSPARPSPDLGTTEPRQLADSRKPQPRRSRAVYKRRKKVGPLGHKTRRTNHSAGSWSYTFCLPGGMRRKQLHPWQRQEPQWQLTEGRQLKVNQASMGSWRWQKQAGQPRTFPGNATAQVDEKEVSLSSPEFDQAFAEDGCLPTVPPGRFIRPENGT